MELKAGQLVMRSGSHPYALGWRYEYWMVPPGETAVVAADQNGVPAGMVRVETGYPQCPTWMAVRETLVVLPNAEPETIAWFRMIYATGERRDGSA